MPWSKTPETLATYSVWRYNMYEITYPTPGCCAFLIRDAIFCSGTAYIGLIEIFFYDCTEEYIVLV